MKVASVVPYNVNFTAMAIDNYLSNVSMEETRIGELNSLSTGSAKELMIYGHYIEANQSPSWISYKVDKAISVQDKFLSINGKSMAELLKEYYETVHRSAEEIQEKLKTLNKLNKNKLVIMPLKPGVACVVDGIEHSSNQVIKVKGVEWYTDKEDSTVKSRVYLRVTGPAPRTYKFELTEYIEKFRISGLDMNCTYTKADASIIKMNSNGMIKPIIFDDGASKIGIDNTFVYKITDKGILIIGEWRDNELYIVNNDKSKAMSKLEACKAAIKVHKNYIAPLYTIPANVVRLRGGK